MRIQSINSVAGSYQNNNTEKSAFKGIWMRMGQDAFNPEMYSSGVYYKFTNGKDLKSLFDNRTGRRLRSMGTVNMTVEEGKDAYTFLFEKIKNSKGYEAVKKLKTFMQSLSTRDDIHNVMFLEKDDFADVTKERGRLNLTDVSKKLLDYELENGLTERRQITDTDNFSEELSTEEFHEMITQFGIA